MRHQTPNVLGQVVDNHSHFASTITVQVHILHVVYAVVVVDVVVDVDDIVELDVPM